MLEISLIVIAIAAGWGGSLISDFRAKCVEPPQNPLIEGKQPIIYYLCQGSRPKGMKNWPRQKQKILSRDI